MNSHGDCKVAFPSISISKWTVRHHFQLMNKTHVIVSALDLSMDISDINNDDKRVLHSLIYVLTLTPKHTQARVKAQNLHTRARWAWSQSSEYKAYDVDDQFNTNNARVASTAHSLIQMLSQRQQPSLLSTDTSIYIGINVYLCVPFTNMNVNVLKGAFAYSPNGFGFVLCRIKFIQATGVWNVTRWKLSHIIITHCMF